MFKRLLSFFKPVDTPTLTRIEQLYQKVVAFNRVCTEPDIRTRCTGYINTKADSIDDIIIELTSLLGIIKYRNNDGYYDNPSKWLLNAPRSMLLDNFIVDSNGSHTGLVNSIAIILSLLKSIVEEVPKHNDALVLYYNNKPKILYSEIESVIDALLPYMR